MEIQIMVFYIVTVHSNVAGYHCFRGLCYYLHLQGPWKRRQHGPTTLLHGVTNQETSTWIFHVAKN